MSGGGSSSGTQVTKSEPWSGQMPYLQDVFARAQALGNQPQTYFPWQTYAAPSMETIEALDRQALRARTGSPLTAAANRNLTDTLGGTYLSAGNPYFSSMFDQAAKAARSQLDSQFASSGRYGSGAHAHAMADALTDAAGRLSYDNYAQERQNQLRALEAAPALANQDYYDIAKLAEVGATREDAAQQQIDDALNRYNFAQQEPWQRLLNYNALIQGGFGSTVTSTNAGARRSLGSSMLGGAASGAALGSSIMPGWGTAIGAAGGALLGALGR